MDWLRICTGGIMVELEVIEKLAGQAGLEYNFDPMLWLKYEKFAELIVRECAEVAEDYDGAHYVDTAIKQHFGVEE